jgi:hypothetical protein
MLPLLACLVLAVASTVPDAPAVPAAAQENPPAPAQDLEKALAEIRSQVDALRAAKTADEARIRELESRYQSLLEELESRRGAQPGGASLPSWMDRFTLGGYGEIHANFVNGEPGDQIDLHRFVLYLGYRFEDWIQLHSEVDNEHGLVSTTSGRALDGAALRRLPLGDGEHPRGPLPDAGRDPERTPRADDVQRRSDFESS